MIEPFDNSDQCWCIVIESAESVEVSKTIGPSHLDAPKNGMFIAKSDTTLRLAGWVLASDQGVPLCVVAKSGSKTTSTPLSIRRKDVLERTLPAELHNSKSEVCGFVLNIDLDIPADVEISLGVGGRLTPWKRLRFSGLTLDMQKGLRAWHAFSRDRLSEIDEAGVAEIQGLSENLVNAMIFGSPKAGRNADNAVDLKCFEQKDQGELAEFVEVVHSAKRCVGMIRSALDFGEVQIKNPFGPGFAVCRESFHVLNGLLVLRFVAPGGECFYIFQHVTAADVVYFPTRNFVLLEQHLGVADVRDAVVAMCGKFSQLLQYSRNRASNRLLGVFASHGRPYHFYYDVAPGVHMLQQEELLSRVPSIVMGEGADFYSFKALYGLACDEAVKSTRELEGLTWSQGGYFLHVGTNHSKNEQSQMQDFDRLFVSHVLEGATTQDKLEAESARTCFPLIWFGVMAQKRCWVEQVEGAAQIVCELARSFPGMGIVFDGWTSPQGVTEGDRVETAKDLAVVNDIISRIPSSVRTYSVVGATSARKMVFASVVDAFVANHATGSMYVARFLKKPGVSHINGRMKKEQHLHFSTVEVPADQVVDMPSSADVRADFVDYSIKSDVVLGLLKDVLARASVTNRLI